ncbi:hypothetical protein M231_03812 [Tremella mesenterica]|uniref:Uncharacterized protein n=1 Tax=Tremella mesenterica TaxID=5217 RepID=A0A4Q1BM22_TREME|nr:hypothetical protein M231_03812 [Tremella mesenterica]
MSTVLPLQIPVVHPSKRPATRSPLSISGANRVVPEGVPFDQSLKVGNEEPLLSPSHSGPATASIATLRLPDALVPPDHSPSLPRRISTTPMYSPIEPSLPDRGIPDIGGSASATNGTTDASSTVRPNRNPWFPASVKNLPRSGTPGMPPLLLSLEEHLPSVSLGGLTAYGRLLQALPSSESDSDLGVRRNSDLSIYGDKTAMPECVDELIVECCVICGRIGGRKEIGLRQTQAMGIQWICIYGCRRPSTESNVEEPVEKDVGHKEREKEKKKEKKKGKEKEREKEKEKEKENAPVLRKGDEEGGVKPLEHARWDQVKEVQ